MTQQNTQYYDIHAQEFFDATIHVDMEPLYQMFLPYIDAGGHILDAGCGSGRDSKAFKEKGYKVTAMDASYELAKQARAYAGIVVEHKTFQQIEEISRFDGIWCCASLLHVPYAELSDVFARLSRALKPTGAMYVSFKYGEPTQLARLHNGRYFTDLNEPSLNTVLANNMDLKVTKTWVTGDRRENREGELWLNAIITKGNIDE